MRWMSWLFYDLCWLVACVGFVLVFMVFAVGYAVVDALVEGGL